MNAAMRFFRCFPLRRASVPVVLCLIVSSLIVLCLTAGCGGGGGDTHATASAPVFATIDGPGAEATGGGTILNGISSNGTIVGLIKPSNADFLRDASGGITTFSVSDTAGDMANAVNKAGTVVGTANGGVFLRQNGVQTALSLPIPGNCSASGINDSGAIVGQYVSVPNAGGPSPPLDGLFNAGFVYANGTLTTVQPAFASNPAEVYLEDINNKGKAVGYYSPDGLQAHGFAYDVASGQSASLPDPSTTRTGRDPLVATYFLGLNDDGVAVGCYQTRSGSQYGFLFNLATQKYTYLDEPNAAPVNGAQTTQITGISDAGELCGFYVDASGKQHGFVATGAAVTS